MYESDNQQVSLRFIIDESALVNDELKVSSKKPGEKFTHGNDNQWEAGIWVVKKLQLQRAHKNTDPTTEYTSFCRKSGRWLSLWSLLSATRDMAHRVACTASVTSSGVWHHLDLVSLPIKKLEPKTSVLHSKNNNKNASQDQKNARRVTWDEMSSAWGAKRKYSVTWASVPPSQWPRGCRAQFPVWSTWD